MKIIALDLDDTLYPEADFVDSAYRHIAKELEHRGMLNRLLGYAIMEESRDMRQAIDRLRLTLGTSAPPAQWFVNLYRDHRPTIALAADTLMQLRTWKNVGYRLAIVTDGRSTTQGNKIAALGLHHLVEPRDIIISEEVGADKNSDVPFRKLMERNPEAKAFAYVGDNPEKDFKWPNALGWTTAMLLGDSRNLKSQSLARFDREYHPQQTLHSLSELQF